MLYETSHPDRETRREKREHSGELEKVLSTFDDGLLGMFSGCTKGTSKPALDWSKQIGRNPTQNGPFFDLFGCHEIIVRIS